MNRWMKWGAVCLAAGWLAACGGSDDPAEPAPPAEQVPHGAIAFNDQSAFAVLVKNYANADLGMQGALSQCGHSRCKVLLTFSGHGVCGAISGAANGVVGVGQGKPLSVAQNAAKENCAANGGRNCGIQSNLPGLCND